MPDISVTITTVNRAERLALGLQSLLSQDFPQNSFEVIVADNGSTDNTKAVAETFADKFENFSYIYDSRPGQLIGWHRALEVSQGKILCFIDDDVCPDPGWLSGVGDVFRDESVGLATGPIKLQFEKEEPDWLNHMKIGEKGAQTLPAFGMLDFGNEIREIPGNFVWGTNFCVRKESLFAVGGFHPCAMPGPLLRFYGDGEIHVGKSISELGHKVMYHPEASVVHNIPNERTVLAAVKSKFMTTGFARSFAMLRHSGEPYAFPSDDEFRSMTMRYFPEFEKAPNDLAGAVFDGLKFGITEHLQSFIEEEAFREWVMQANYLDLDKCYVHPDLIESAQLNHSSDWRSGE